MNNLIETAIQTLRRFEPMEGYFLAFSGGKDSIACYQLLKLSGVKFTATYSITTVDEPFVKPFIRKHYPEVIFDYPERSMFKLIETKGILPTRKTRYCCEFLKEYSGKGRLVITGVRKAESIKRKKRQLFELDSRKKMLGKAYLNPIIDWTLYDVWNFIREYRLQVPDYYAEDCGSRGGCVGCPFAGVKQMKREFQKYPRYKNAYLKAIRKAKKNGFFQQFQDEFDVFNWWISDLSIKNYMAKKNQTKIQF